MPATRNKTCHWQTITKNLKVVYMPEFSLLKLVKISTGEVIDSENYLCITPTDWGNTVNQLKLKYSRKLSLNNKKK